MYKIFATDLGFYIVVNSALEVVAECVTRDDAIETRRNFEAADDEAESMDNVPGYAERRGQF